MDKHSKQKSGNFRHILYTHTLFIYSCPRLLQTLRHLGLCRLKLGNVHTALPHILKCQINEKMGRKIHLDFQNVLTQSFLQHGITCFRYLSMLTSCQNTVSSLERIQRLTAKRIKRSITSNVKYLLHCLVKTESKDQVFYYIKKKTLKKGHHFPQKKRLLKIISQFFSVAGWLVCLDRGLVIDIYQR